ncbi:hypothetical protein L9F63_014643 [Diploptera punctata]|uniref:Uncharacterized protein n=1 Tax=Diploptera punctata TaxID=6984 RepID=A0AAD8A7K9_DIPPU|nr:hypothetical protein L9F63_014643 [Diploptera punctata]
MYSTDKLAFPVKKGSQFREHITQKARWLREIGFVGREYKRWFYQTPKCDSNSQGFVSVRLLDFYPVLFPSDRVALSLITSFILEANVSSAVLATCWNSDDTKMVVKDLSKNDFMVAVRDPEINSDTTLLLKTKYRHLAVIVDLGCRGSFEFIRNANKNNYQKLLHHWLLLEETSSDNETSTDQMTDMLETIEFLVDSQVFLAHYLTGGNGAILQEIFKFGRNESLTFTQVEYWTPNQKLPSKVKRDDYGGISINTVVVVIDDVWENFFDLRYRYVNTLGKATFTIHMLIAQIEIKKTMNLTFTDTWGFPRNGTECYDGVVGLLQCGDVEIGALAILFKIPRLDRIQYAGETFNFPISFKFLKPSLSEVSILYTLPFSTSVWLSYVGMVILLCIVLYYSEKIQHKVNPTSDDPPMQLSDVYVYILAIICQEGSPRSPDNVSSRIVFLFLLLLSLFLTTSYSAIIVSLLQTPSEAINSMSELIDSPFKLSMRDFVYNIKLVDDSTDPIMQRLFYKKLFTRPFHEAFTSDEIGVENLRTGLNAFYAGPEAYKVMSNTYEEYEKCRLKEIILNPSNLLSIPIKKGSSYKNHVTQKCRRLKETGMIDRVYKTWYTQKPTCVASSQGFVSVRIKDFYPTLVVLSIGLLVSITLLFIELFYHKIRYGMYWP